MRVREGGGPYWNGQGGRNGARARQPRDGGGGPGRVCGPEEVRPGWF